MDQLLTEMGKAGPVWILLAVILITLFQAVKGGFSLLVTKGLPYLFDDDKGKLTGLLTFHKETLVEGKQMVKTVTECAEQSTKDFAEVKEIIKAAVTQQSPLIETLKKDLEKILAALSQPRFDLSDVTVSVIEMLCGLGDNLDVPPEVRHAHRSKLTEIKMLLAKK